MRCIISLLENSIHVVLKTVGWWQNKCVVKGVMALKGSIYDCGGALTGAYAKEVALTKCYQYLYNIWLM